MGNVVFVLPHDHASLPCVIKVVLIGLADVTP